MGEHPDRAAKAAQDGEAALSSATRLRGRRDAAEAFSRLVVQIRRYDDGARTAAGSMAVERGLFLILVEADEAETTALRFGVALDAAALAEHCPCWRQYAYRPIAADEGLAAVVRNHIAVLAEQAASIDAPTAMAMRPMTIGLVAALLNSLDGRFATEPVGLPAFHRKRIKEFVLNNLCDPVLDIDMIAAAVGLSARYIHHLFAGEPTSLMQWIITKRLLHCHGQLVDPRRRHRKISQIAYDAGFNDMAHFSRSFRKHFSISPSQARSAAQ